MRLALILFSFQLVIHCSYLSQAQDNKLRINLDESGQTYIKASFRGQFWLRYLEMNPGTHIDNDSINSAVDFSIRRVRIGVSAQLTPRLFIYSLLGNNNLNVKNEQDFIIDILDFYAEYKFSDMLEVGLGESAWGGQSRWNVRSTLSYMALDAPLFVLSTVNKNDDLARTLGIWAKGQLGKFDYVAAIKEPASFGVTAQEDVTDYALGREQFRYSGYIKYEFLDNESNKTPFSGGTGTYLGNKNIFNLGGGIMYQGDMTSSLVDGVERFYDFKCWTVELFYDAPLNENKGTAITSYLGYFSTDFGPNYIRNVGANDYTEGGTSFNGSGNDYPMMGTGGTVFFQFGYLMEKMKTKYYRPQFQPNIAIQFSDYEKLDEPVITYDVGINLYLKGHANKLTLGWQNRPVFQENANESFKVDERKNMMVLQYQITIN